MSSQNPQVPKQAQPEKNDKRGEGSVVPKTDNPINAPEPDSGCMGFIALFGQQISDSPVP